MEPVPGPSLVVRSCKGICSMFQNFKDVQYHSCYVYVKPRGSKSVSSQGKLPGSQGPRLQGYIVNFFLCIFREENG